jgi:hypothetical protein
VNENSAVANELRIASEAISQAAVATDYQRRPALLAKYGERGRAMYLQDTRFHLSYLAEAISVGRPSIFKDYLGDRPSVSRSRAPPPRPSEEN